MLLTIDIGNTYITLGSFAARGTQFDSKLRFMARMVTERRRTDDQFACDLLQLLTLHRVRPEEITDAIICSVVPDLTSVLQSATKKLTGAVPMILGPGVKTGLPILLDNPAQLGSDLVAGAVAASRLYPVPAVIFDLGTATTVSVLDGEGRFRGGAICAGIHITLDSLASKTALLPHVDLACPKSVIGRNTIHSMQSGAVYGTAALMDGMTARIEEELGQSATVIVTGSLADIVAPVCRREVHVCENLLLTGLRMIYEKNSR